MILKISEIYKGHCGGLMEDKEKRVIQEHKFWKRTAIFFILVITFVSFLPCLSHNFLGTWDVTKHLTANTAIRAIHTENIREIFTITINQVYIPLTLLSFALEYYFFGYNPFIYHFSNLLLHMAVTSLIFLFALRVGVTLRAAFLAALLFGIHPMHVGQIRLKY